MVGCNNVVWSLCLWPRVLQLQLLRCTFDTINRYWGIAVVPGFHHERAKGDEPTIRTLPLVIVCLFLCLSVGIKPENPYSASCVGREVNFLGVITHGQRHKPRTYQRQRHEPRTCRSIVHALQVEGLARTPGLTPAPYKAHPQPLNSVPQCLVWRIGGV